MHPDQPLHCLLVQPKFSASCYWNYVSVCELMGAKAIQPPLGLLTVAALLPKHWEIRIADLNVGPLRSEDWQWADFVGTGGMLPQQKGILEIIRRAKRDGKYVVVGGPDPTSQVELYRQADAVVMGEGELTIPQWLDSWSRGIPQGRFQSPDKPDVTKSPIPRFDLVNLDDYMHVGVQYSRGCPFNCEFCDIIELYGRIPRTKTTPQLLAELDRLYQLGYRGWVDLVDDNFIGNKRNVKRMLPGLQAWCRDHRYPFYFTTEASMNIADDVDLMGMMRDVDFRWIFMGIETPDPELLRSIQKRQNTMRPIAERVQKVYQHGIGVAAGFILGFDDEQDGMDQAMIQCIDQACVIFALIGLLIACPNTQLATRLKREGRLIDLNGHLLPPDADDFCVNAEQITSEHIDTSTTGLNFITTRDRATILKEFASVIRTIYSPRDFFDRVLRTTRMMDIQRHHRPRGKELWRLLRGACRASIRLVANPRTRRHFWNVLLPSLAMGPRKFEFAMMAMAFFVHFEQQTDALLDEIQQRRQAALAEGSIPENCRQSVRSAETA